ncbi:Putative tRNA methyltransferase, Trm1, S-adenosyl-L-methionine-dependent methyltransferase [Septoria linicola]|uniref:tRNA (guanine(26)-N(2))-dimethyltransferase n=1 Tax=Septoria linicola TaxID=215465 RepID=A0A9Q9AVD5_9PEZI|nr:Putative tRNA methyltransferase, Trm1, S-adenosyl-L-methionine-dependent methyltransferase [Septoria linicola]
MTTPAVPLSAAPAAGQLVEHDGKTYETIREGQAYILIPPNTQQHVTPPQQAKPKGKPEEAAKAQSVFYNPIQQFNRDLSVLAIKAFGDDFLHRKKLRNEKNREKHDNKNKRKRKQPLPGESDEGRVKLRKTEEGPVRVESADQTGGPDKSEAVSTVAGASNAETEQINGHDAPTESAQQPKVPAGPRFRILDALSATGLRALRYAHEIPYVSAVVANDMNPSAIESVKLNVEHNKLSSKITPNLDNAIGHMYRVAFAEPGTHGPHHVNQKYDVVDLDPYGTAAPFIDAALQSLNEGGLLCVTCTDSGVFASTGYCEKTWSLYGGAPIKGPHMHEGGLRLIINSVATAAAKQGLAIEPLLSLSIDFYVRTFIRVRKSPADVKFLFGKTMDVLGCDHGCGAWTVNMRGRNTKQTGKDDSVWWKHTTGQGPAVDQLCEHCGSKRHIAGPMWAGPLHNAAFVGKILEDLQDADGEVYKTKPRIEGMLHTALDELKVNDEVIAYKTALERKDSDEMVPKVPPETIDHFPFFFSPSAVSKVIHCIAPNDASIRGALRHAGYRATRSHCQPGSIKTDAPWSAIWNIMTEWTRQKHPVKESALKEGSAGYTIMKKARAVWTAEGESEAAESKNEDQPEDTASETTPGITTETTSAMAEAPQANGAAPTRQKVVFDEALGKDKQTKHLVRYQQNPRENWGPMTKHKGNA